MQEIAGHTGALLREQKFNTGLVALMQSALRENPSARRFICDADTIRKIGNIARGDHDRFISMFNERKDNTTTSTPTCSLLHVDSFKTGRLSTLFERTISDSMAKRVLEENIVALREVNSHTKTIKDTQGAISDTLSPSIQKNDKKGDSSTE
ncbi:hypothetical protein KBC03_06860 [Patescibacteria group bacterium]|nr:hypothetical protein [Patescibacteria group bacterium]